MPLSPDSPRLLAASRDSGRVAFGTILTAVLLLAVAAGAVAFLVSIGVLSLPGSEQPGDASPSADVSAAPSASAGPQWLEGAGLDLPPYLNVEDEREPRARFMQPWLWDYVDEQWALRVDAFGDGDGGTFLHDLQVMYLQAPDGELFRLWELRADYTISVVHWDSELEVAWLMRNGREQPAPVVEFDLRTAENTDNWAGGAVSAANAVAGGVGNVTYVGDQPDGLELWASYDTSGLTTGVFWRDGDRFLGSVMNAELRRLRLQGFSEDEGAHAWVDPETMTAVYRAVDRNDGRVRDERWLLHDLSDDGFREVDPQVPGGADCVTPFDIDEPGQFEGDRIVARCNGDTVLIDPTGESGPQS